MKPKTKLQKRLYDISINMPDLTDTHKEYAYKKLFDKHCVVNVGNKVSCLECGHQWIGEHKVCPSCSSKLKLHKGMARKYYFYDFMAVLEKAEEFMVIRYLHVRKYEHKGKPAKYDSCEVQRVFVYQDNRIEVFSKSRSSSNYHANDDCWSWGNQVYDEETHTWSIAQDKNFTLRSKFRPHNHIHVGCSYKKYYVFNVFKRNGFKNDFFFTSPVAFFHQIVIDSQLETLVKLEHKALVSHYYRCCSHERLWPQVLIALRHGFNLSTAKRITTWVDYLKLLNEFEKDLNSPKYVCPDNLNAAHNRYVKLKQRRIEEERRKAVREEIEKRERQIKEFYEQKKVFFGLQFKHKDLLIKVLESVDEYEQEGKALGHCIFTNAYYGKSDTLCLSARRKDKPVESIEISLKDYKIIQSHGLRNQNSRYHDKIIKLIESNINKIKQAHKIAI